MAQYIKDIPEGYCKVSSQLVKCHKSMVQFTRGTKIEKNRILWIFSSYLNQRALENIWMSENWS